MGSYKVDRSSDRDPSNGPDSSGGKCVYNWSTAWSLLLPRSRTDIRRVAAQIASLNFISGRISRIRIANTGGYSGTCVCVLDFEMSVSRKSERPKKWKSEKMSFLMKPRVIPALLLRRLQRLNNNGVVENALQSGPDDSSEKFDQLLLSSAICNNEDLGPLFRKAFTSSKPIPPR